MRIEATCLDDADAIMQYLRTCWKSDHILGVNRELFLHLYRSGEGLNFVVARVEAAGEIDGICGYIAASSDPQPDLWNSLWHSRRSKTDPLLGMRLMQSLRETVPHRSLSCGGINVKTRPLYGFLGSQCHVFRQFYLPNCELSEFRIAQFPRRPTTEVKPKPLNRLERIETPEKLAATFDLPSTRDRIPFKDLNYLRRRYFEFPGFRYEVYGLRRGASYSSLMMLRQVPANHAHCLRLVDFIGSNRDWTELVPELYGLVLERRAEYLDFLHFGTPRETLLAAGFRELDPDDDNIVVPNYFAPFVRKNVRIHLMYDDTAGLPLTLCKADGDQDRPNLVAESYENLP
jgi:hypothetical protein